MTLDQYQKATPLIQQLEVVNKCIYESNDLIEKLKRDDTHSTKHLSGPNGGYGIHLCMHRDGSGPKVDMVGCYVAIAVAEATMKILKDKKTELETMLGDI